MVMEAEDEFPLAPDLLEAPILVTQEEVEKQAGAFRYANAAGFADTSQQASCAVRNPPAAKVAPRTWQQLDKLLSDNLDPKVIAAKNLELPGGSLQSNPHILPPGRNNKNNKAADNSSLSYKTLSSADEPGDGWVKIANPETGLTYCFLRKGGQHVETKWEWTPVATPRPTPNPTPRTSRTDPGNNIYGRPNTAPEATNPYMPRRVRVTANNAYGRPGTAPAADSPESPLHAGLVSACRYFGDRHPEQLSPEAKQAALEKHIVLEQLQRTQRDDEATRKKTLKFLYLRWHPDKNPDNMELAKEVFQFLQMQRKWYLPDHPDSDCLF